MRNKIASLIVGLMVIMLAPCLVSWVAAGNEAPPTEKVVLAGDVQDCTQMAYLGQDEYQVATQEPAATPAEVVSDTSFTEAVTDNDSPFAWKNILLLILTVFSVFFATLWKNARSTITAIDAALKDGKIDKTELNSIIRAWKGN